MISFASVTLSSILIDSLADQATMFNPADSDPSVTASDLTQIMKITKKIYDYREGLAGLIYIIAPAVSNSLESCEVLDTCTIPIGSYTIDKSCSDIPSIVFNVWVNGSSGSVSDPYPNSLAISKIQVGNVLSLSVTPTVANIGYYSLVV